ncbi:MAG TPA: hypothetical protein PKA88_27140 [Polyangiaceae bacterium]|nr:hypothetical protein [Polyangiaceae bacterium]
MVPRSKRSIALLWVSTLGLLAALLAVACGDQAEDSDALDQGLSEGTAQPAESERPVEPEFHFEGAERVVLGTVEQVSAGLGQNEWGDTLILSTVRVRVWKQLRGTGGDVIEFQLEGGTLGDTTLNVSDLPRPNPGDQGVFALRRHRTREGWVPNLRGSGIRIGDIDAHLEAIQRAELASR